MLLANGMTTHKRNGNCIASVQDAESTKPQSQKMKQEPQEQEEDSSKVSVMVRVRPLSTMENANPSMKSVVQCLKDGILVNGAQEPSASRFFGARHAQRRPQHFRVDTAFHPHTSQLEVYEACRAVVADCLQGINVSILAYGATGSGKTHTMFGGTMSAAGVIYQSIQDILEYKDRLEADEMKVMTVRCSFLEVYNEEVYDLLAPTSTQGKRTPLLVRDLGQEDEESNSSTFNASARRRGSISSTHVQHTSRTSGVNPESLTVKGLIQITPNTAEEFAKCIERGHTNRFVAATNANAQSSRSHAILTVEVEVKDNMNASLGTIGRIRFCDLAGSERAAGTTNSGIRLREGGNINRSLLALGAVVHALARRKRNPKRQQYVPYRDSKLTRLLRDCIGGNCRTIMLFCVSPNSMHYEETINTMHFATKAREIRVAAKRHEFCINSKEIAKSQETLIEELRTELAAAREELLRLRGCSQHASLQGSWTPQYRSRLSAHTSPLCGETAVHTAESVFAIPSPTLPPAGTLRVGKKDAIPSLLPSVVAENEPLAIAKPFESSLPVPLTLSPLKKKTPQLQPSSRSLLGDVEMQRFSPFMSPNCSPSHVALAPGLSRSTRTEVSDSYTEVQNKLKEFSVTKETLYRAMQEAQEKNSELDVRLREHNWKLARFLTTKSRKLERGQSTLNGIHSASNGVRNGHSHTGPVTPVGVARLRHTIEQIKTESAARGDEVGRLLEKMNETDRTIASIRQELLREKQHPLLELLLDNVRLRQSCTEAECLAAHYHQQTRIIINREEEYAQALSVCAASIRRMIPLVTNTNTRDEAQHALMYANLPSLPTAEMIPVFERAIRSGCPPPSSSLESPPRDASISRAESVESHLLRALKGRKSTPREGTTTPPATTKPNARQTPSLNTKAGVKSRGRPEPFGRSYTTTTLRQPRSNGPSSPKTIRRPSDSASAPSRKPRGGRIGVGERHPNHPNHLNNVAKPPPRRACSVGDGRPRVSNGETVDGLRKGANNVPVSHAWGPQRTRGTSCTRAAVPFARSQTVPTHPNDVHSLHSCEQTPVTAVASLGDSLHGLHGLPLTGSSSGKENGCRRRTPRKGKGGARVTFVSASRERNDADGGPVVKPTHRTQLEARFDELLNHVKQLRKGQRRTEAAQLPVTRGGGAENVKEKKKRGKQEKENDLS